MITPQDLIERITSAATTDDCVVVISEKTQANLRWANSTLTTNGVIAERSITVIAFIAVDGGMAAGSVTRTDINIGDIPTVLAEASAAAKASGAAEDFVPLAKSVVSGTWQDAHNPTGPEVFAKIAPDLGDMFARSVADKIELFGYAEHTNATTFVGSKGGLRLRYDLPVGRVEMTGKSHQRTRSTWDGIATRDFSNVKIANIDANIRERLNWQAKKIDLPAGRYDTIMPSGTVTDLFTYMMWTSAARAAHEGRSVFSKPGGGTRIGEKLSNVSMQLFSDPSYNEIAGLECSPFVANASSGPFSSVFDNGQSVKRTDWLKNGELTSLIQTRSSAAATKLPYTPISDNLIMKVDNGTGSLSDLVKKVNHGLLLTTMWYIRMVDANTLLLTGLTRDGVYYVKDGEVQGATNNFRWNDSPVSVLSRVIHAGATEWTQAREWAGDIDRAAFPPLVIKDFNMSTVSPGS
ncbi:MAG: hypothetical protein F2943_04885 [Actinobacteria bacterium]|uniref:Unannotated protein n=1 Tax=freshwater metagenome TaxID=449393 RepID=A0A6J7UM11_9ZZZZ|nr:hypothetical protein [Actinomycetota bacterium]